MGCSAAKNLTVTENTDPRNFTSNSKPKMPDIVGEDLQAELLEAENVTNIQKTPHGLSFEIAFDDDENESIIKKHPPKRFQKLEEQQVNGKETLFKLQEKLDEAEIRRQQILQQRVQSAKHRTHLKKQSSVASLPEDEQENYLKIPDEFTPRTYIQSHA